MITTIPKSVKLWGRGQLTIPKEVREAMRIDESTQLNVFVVGNSLMLTPKTLRRASLAKEAEKSMAKQGLSLEDLLENLKVQRQRTVREKYAG